MIQFNYPPLSINTAGLATSSGQATGNASLASIDSKTPALGQQLAASSQPVVLTAVQLSTLTPLTAVTANAGTNLNTSALALDSTVAKDSSLSTLNTSVNTLLKPASTLAAVTSITNTVTIKADTAVNQTNAMKVDGSAVTQPVSGAFFQATQPVSAATLPLPSGASTSTLQTSGNSSLSSIDTKVPALGQALAAASVPIVLTAVQLSTLTPLTAVTANAGTNLNTSALALDSTVAKDSSLSTLNTSVNTLLKPASTLAAVTTVSAVTAITNALPTGTNTIGAVKLAGKSSANAPVRNDYTATSVTTAAYVQLVASTTSACTEIEIFDSSGQTLVLAIGAAASEVNQINIFPGGNGRVPLIIAAGTRVSIKAVSATASVGEININFYG